eukprot:jgi/Orpsp1_1/1190869/evm.model.d7180000081748.1
MKLLNTFILIVSLGLVSSKKPKDDNEQQVDTLLPKFNLPSGFYDEETIELEIIKPDPDAIIYYTLDGSIPTENSTIYENPFILKNKSDEENVYSATKNTSINYTYIPIKKVRKANIIRTVAKLPDGSLTNVVSGSYFVGLNKKELYGDLPVISLITDPDNLFDYEKGIYVLGKRYDEWKNVPGNENAPAYMTEGNFSIKGKESERPATIEYIPGNNTTAAFSHDLGIRMKGKASRGYNQKSFRLISREEYGKKNLKYELIPGNMRSDGKGVVTKYKSFVLRNGGNDSHFTKLRDRTLQYLIANHMFENQQSDYVIVFIDGEYWGIYSIYEEYDDHYIANNYDIDNKNVVIVKPSKNIEAGTEEDLKKVNDDIKYVQANDMSISSNYDKASEKFDILGLCWYSAFYAYIECKDGWFYGSNMAMWRVREPDSSVPKADGKIRFLTYDTEFSAGLYEGDNTRYDIDIFPDLLNEKSFISSIRGTRMVRSLLKNDEFKSMFINALCDIYNIIFDEEIVNNSIDKTSSILLPLIRENIERFGYPVEHDGIEPKPEPEDHFKSEVNNFKTWLKNRRTVFMKYVANAFGLDPAVKIS